MNQEKNQILKESHPFKSLEKSLSAYDSLSKKEQIIFLAGVFDGEGSFGVWSRGTKKTKKLQVKVETTDFDMVKRFADFFGGQFYKIEKRRSHWKDSYRWRLVGDHAWKPLELMIPYMCQRRREKFYGLVKPTGYGCEDWGSYLQKQARVEKTNVRRPKIACSKDGIGRN